MSTDIQDVNTLLDLLADAIKAASKKDILEIYGATELIDWDNTPNDIAERYDQLVDDGNDVLNS